MKRPRFTDSDRYPLGYTHAKATDIRKTWARERKRLADEKAKQEAAQTEQQTKVRKLKQETK